MFQCLEKAGVSEFSCISSACLSLVYTGSMRTAKESNPESAGEVVTHHSTPPVDSAEDETRGSKVWENLVCLCV